MLTLAISGNSQGWTVNVLDNGRAIKGFACHGLNLKAVQAEAQTIIDRLSPPVTLASQCAQVASLTQGRTVFMSPVAACVIGADGSEITLTGPLVGGWDSSNDAIIARLT